MPRNIGTKYEEEIEYPQSDGKPMADNVNQAKWIVKLYNNLMAKFRGEEVFVAADILWYPVKGRRDIVVAPDILVAFGRPQGYRPSYKQWLESDVAPQVVIEVLSPSNSAVEMLAKQAFYDRHGVSEYIVLNPGEQDDGIPIDFEAYVRRQGSLEQVLPGDEWLSKLLGLRFWRVGSLVQVEHADGSPLLTFEELQEERNEAFRQAEAHRRQAEYQRKQAQLHQEQAQLHQEQAQLQRKQAEKERAAKNKLIQSLNAAEMSVEQIALLAGMSKQEVEAILADQGE